MACSMRRLVLVLLLLLFACAPARQAVDERYACQGDEDCVHTCGAGCANARWAESYRDPCVNIRAFDCTCVRGECYSDGRPPG